MENEPPSWRAELLMALAGPLASLVLGAGLVALASALAGPLEIDFERTSGAVRRLGPLATLLMWLGPVNVMLGLFNLVPGFPLDGGRVLRAVMRGTTGNLRRATRLASQVGQGFAFLLVGTGVAMVLGVRVPVFGSGLLGGIWLTFIGWFLNNAAVLSYRQLVVRESLEHVPAEAIMRTQLARVAPQTPLSTVVDELVLPTGQRAFPVEENGRFVGLLALRDLYGLGRAAWERGRVADVMIPAERLATMPTGEAAANVIGPLGQRHVNQVPVVAGGGSSGSSAGRTSSAG